MLHVAAYNRVDMRRLLVVLAVLTGPAAAQPAPEPDAALDPLPVQPAELAVSPAGPPPPPSAATPVSPPLAPTQIVRADAISPSTVRIPTPPAPLILRELVARSRWSLSLATIASFDGLAWAVIPSGSFALGDFELFGSAPLIGLASICFEGCTAGTPGETGLGNLRAGARYVHALGSFAFAPSVWGWLPTQTASDRWFPRARAVTTSAFDSRAFSTEGALGVAFDAAWRSTTTVVQAQLGMALVADGGPQVDNVFGSVAASTLVSKHTALLGEWRVDAYPLQPRIQVFGAGVGRGDPSSRMWRVRMHVVRAGTLEATGRGVGALEVSFDLVQRL